MAAPPDISALSPRTALLTKLRPEKWYDEHAAFETNNPCGCTLDRPEIKCDVGESLYRLRGRGKPRRS